MVVANCWIQYLKDAKYLNIQKNKILDLLHFWLQLANEIINCRKLTTPKRKGRPSNTSTDRSSRCSSNSEDVCTQFSPPTNKKIRTDRPIPPDAVRYDTIDHLPSDASIQNVHKNIEHTFFVKSVKYTCVWLQEEIVLLISISSNDEYIHSTAQEEYLILFFKVYIYFLFIY